MTLTQVNKKYKGKYIQFEKRWDFEKRQFNYKVLKAFSQIRENTTLGEDVGTSLEYCR